MLAHAHGPRGILLQLLNKLASKIRLNLSEKKNAHRRSVLKKERQNGA